MKVLLLQPNFDTHIITPPLGLGYLAGALLKDGHDVILFDCIAKGIDNQKIIEILTKERPDVIGISVLSISFKNTIDLITLIRKNITTLVVIGGPHVSALPEYSLETSKADIAVIGEGENTFREIASGKSLNEINGICFWSDNKIITTPSRPFIDDLDTIPFPAWSLIQPDNYPPTPHGAFYKKYPIAPITTTRGCPFNCIFCASKCTWKQKLRARSAMNVVDEIEYLHRNFGIQEFHFEDDNFTFSKKHAMAVCEEIIRRGLDIVWACPNGVRIDKLDKELIDTMKRSGCYLLAFGIESGSQEILDKMNKKLDLDIVPNIIKMVKDAGIETCGYFIVGLPDETYETIESTIELSLSLPLDRAQFSRFVPLPGTSIFDEWWEKDKNIDWDMINHVGNNSIYCTKNLTKEELTELQRSAFRRFYFRPKILTKTLYSLKPRQYYWFVKRILDYKLF